MGESALCPLRPRMLMILMCSSCLAPSSGIYISLSFLSAPDWPGSSCLPVLARSRLDFSVSMQMNTISFTMRVYNLSSLATDRVTAIDLWAVYQWITLQTFEKVVHHSETHVACETRFSPPGTKNINGLFISLCRTMGWIVNDISRSCWCFRGR